ncbi:Flagellin [Candidatus Defluviicoccus seviourii]|uniref:Flagellin n=1 Tax=Candidatus Defluviicoccus seviourii TaxID=2565273 RepID=A0A564W9M3_9PROT|nr:Flagellin [Candidatus Defluviicoccus seviourii]HRW61107.1 flagellin [Defluviicoccus sp.]
MSSVALSSSMRNNLLSLQKTNSLLETSQLRLSTGLKVNSALDDARSFFTAQGLNNRATDLGRLVDGMGQSVQTVKAADTGVTAMTKLMEQADSIVTQAKEHLNSGGAATDAEIAAFEKDFDALMVQMEGVMEDANYRGINLLTSDKLVTQFNEDNSNTFEIAGAGFGTGTGLGVTWSSATTDWTNADLTSFESRATEISDALTKLRNFSSSLSNGLSIIETRDDFTKSMIEQLQEGADKLTLADPNEEGAKLLALQTRMQLGVSAMSMSAQSQQSVLQML